MSETRLRFVAWSVNQHIKFWNWLKDRMDEGVFPCLDWGLVVKTGSGIIETRRLSDGRKWYVPIDYVRKTKEITTPQELREFEKDFPNWEEKIIKARAEEEKEEQKKLMKQENEKVNKEETK